MPTPHLRILSRRPLLGRPLLLHHPPLRRSALRPLRLALQPQRCLASKPDAAPPAPKKPDARPAPEPDRDARPPQLSRPIGVSAPPQPGENSGSDTRSLSQRRRDLLDWDKHLERRQQLKAEMARPYFRDFSRLSRAFKGKSWIAPPVLFRADKALFFPNLLGRTLVPGSLTRDDTTPALLGKTSVVAVYSNRWAEAQVKTFIAGLETQLPPEAQRVHINVEENSLKALLVRMFLPSLRKRIPEQEWEKYFLVTKGLDMELRHNLGLWNSKVGYVYLVDRCCRIRWAGSGEAEAEEKAAMLRGLRKLADEQKRAEEEEEEREQAVGNKK